MKYALVTGSTNGIGKEIGLNLLAHGYYVVFNYSNSDNEALILENEIRSVYFHKYSIIKKDLSNPESIESFVKEIKSIIPHINVIVFNTGATDRSNFEDITWEIWTKIFNTNVHIPLFILKSMKSIIVENGCVIFIGSKMGNVPHSTSLSYGVSKSAVHSLVKNLVKFFAETKIRINGIAPGFVETEWQKEKPEWLKEKIKSKIALNRFCTTGEVSQLAMHIIENNYLNGEIIQLDGGYNFE